jgi:epidermal growth factor receptor substrate 15
MKIYILISFLFFTLISYSQSLVFRFDGSITNYDTQKKEGGVTVTFIQSGKTMGTTLTSSNGKYNLKVEAPASIPFQIIFSKNSFVSKRVDFEFAKMSLDGRPANKEFSPVADLSIDIFSVRPAIDFSFLNTEPVAAFFWNDKALKSDFDRAGSDRTRKKIEDLLKQHENREAEKEAKYQAAIKNGDQLFAQKKYSDALKKYEEALLYKEREPYPLSKITEIDALLQAQKKEQLAAQQLDAEYNNLIKAGDSFRDQKKYTEALAKYQEAIQKKNEQYPKDQITNMNKLISDQKKEAELEAKYQEAVKLGDDLFVQKKYQESKDKFLVAAALKSTEQYPKTKLAELELKLKIEADDLVKKKKYDETIAVADQLFNSQKFAEAKIKYVEATTFDNTAPYPKTKIKECEAKIASLDKENEKQERIAKLIAEGDLAENQNDFELAKTKYQEVLTIESTNKLVPPKLAALNSKLTAQKNQAEKDAQFEALKKAGMALAVQKKYADANQKLNEALSIKQDSEVSQRIREIDEILKAEMLKGNLEEQYDALLKEAAGLETAKNYDGAIGKYREALTKKPAEAFPKSKISELESLKKSTALQVEQDKKYKQFMDAGDRFMTEKNYLEAIKQFNEAQKIKPSERDPVIKAAEAERLEKSKGQEVDEQYEKILSVAQTSIDTKLYDKAKELLDRAVKLKPTDIRPKEMMAKINQLQLLDKNYQVKVSEGERYSVSKDYERALKSFKDANNLKPEETYPIQRIDELNKLLALKSSESEKEARYAEFMKKGANEVTSLKYDLALANYKEALNQKPDDREAKDKITEVQRLIEAQKKLNAETAKEKAAFNKLIYEADALFKSGTYLDAKKKYDEALSIDSSSSYAKRQSDECVNRSKNLGVLEAQKEYQKIITIADQKFKEHDYDKAREYYKRAISFKDNDPYPKRKLTEIEGILNPTIVVSAKLVDLGDPYDNSILDGQAALIQADNERKNLKSNNMKVGADNITALEIERAREKNEQNLRTENEIFKYQTTSIEITANDDLNRKAMVEAIKDKKREDELTVIQNNNFEKAESIAIKSKFNIVERNIEEDYKVRDAVSRDNLVILNNQNTQYNKELSYQSNLYQTKNILASEQLAVSQFEMELNALNDDAERNQTTEHILQSDKNSRDDYQMKTNQNNEEALKTKQQVADLENAAVSINESDIEHREANDEKLKLISENTSQASINNDLKALNAQELLEQLLSVVKERVIYDESVKDDNRKEGVELLKKENRSFATDEFNKANSEQVKRQTAKSSIHQESTKTNGIPELEQKVQTLNMIDIEEKDNAILKNDQRKQLSDDQERLKTRSKVEDITESIANNTESQTEIRKLNNEALNLNNRTLQNKKSQQGINQTNKLLNQQQTIHTQKNEKLTNIIVGNSLGSEYPEGVSQESFSQKDDKGLLTTITTRRIVVKEGRGVIYVRTQTLNAITYTKDGQPTTEYVWQRETQDGNLVKNY